MVDDPPEDLPRRAQIGYILKQQVVSDESLTPGMVVGMLIGAGFEINDPEATKAVADVTMQHSPYTDWGDDDDE